MDHVLRVPAEFDLEDVIIEKFQGGQNVEQDAFHAGNDIQSGGVLKEGRGFSFGPLGMQFIGGKTRLTSAGMQEGDKVEGEFEGDVMKLIGMGR